MNKTNNHMFIAVLIELRSLTKAVVNSTNPIDANLIEGTIKVANIKRTFKTYLNMTFTKRLHVILNCL